MPTHIIEGDARLTDSRAPSGSAGGGLSGTYPNPTLSSSAIRAASGSTLFTHTASVGNSTTTETDLYSDTLTAGQLASAGDRIEADYGGTFVSSGTASREIKAKFGPSGSETTIFDTGALTLSLSAAWTLWIQIIRVSSSVIRYTCSLTTEGAALSAYTSAGEVTGLTLAHAMVLKVTGQAAGVGAATNDIVALLGGASYKPV